MQSMQTKNQVYSQIVTCFLRDPKQKVQTGGRSIIAADGRREEGTGGVGIAAGTDGVERRHGWSTGPTKTDI